MGVSEVVGLGGVGGYRRIGELGEGGVLVLIGGLGRVCKLRELC